MITTLISALAIQQQPSCCPPSMADFANDPAFVATHLAPIPFHFEPSSGHAVTFKDTKGVNTTGFFVPAKAGSKGAIVMVHEWWGLNDYIKRNAEDLNQKTGYAVLAIDLYDGKVASTPEDAGKYMQGLDVERAKAIVKASVNDLKNGTFGIKAAKIGTVGYCMGGGWSYNTAVAGGKDVNACVVYYGLPDVSPAAINAIKAPVLFIHPKQDKWINDKVVEGFETAFKAAKKPYTVLNYDTDHAFANPSNPKYDKAAAGDARAHELAFFRKYIG